MSMTREYSKAIPPETTGFTKKCEFHMSYEHKGQRCGRAVYRIHDPDGIPTPIAHRYDTNPDTGYNGYFVDGCETKFGKWSDAAAQWNAMLAVGEKGEDAK